MYIKGYLETHIKQDYILISWPENVTRNPQESTPVFLVGAVFQYSLFAGNIIEITVNNETQLYILLYNRI